MLIALSMKRCCLGVTLEMNDSYTVFVLVVGRRSGFWMLVPFNNGEILMRLLSGLVRSTPGYVHERSAFDLIASIIMHLEMQDQSRRWVNSLLKVILRAVKLATYLLLSSEWACATELLLGTCVATEYLPRPFNRPCTFRVFSVFFFDTRKVQKYFRKQKKYFRSQS